MKRILDPWMILSRLFPRTKSGDRLFSTLKFLRVHGRMPSPSSLNFSDALFSIKSSDEIIDPLRVFTTDKEYFKIYASAVVGEKHIVPTLAVLRSEDDVDEYNFPSEFCIKPTHMSGKVIISRDGLVDINVVKSWFSINHYDRSRERNYKNLKPKLIVEPIIFGQDDITDFRIFCRNGRAKIVCLDIGKYSNYRRAFYSLDWVKQPYSLGYSMYKGDIKRPENLSEMILAAEKLSHHLGFVRVDFYTNGEAFYLGELTHCHASASQKFSPKAGEDMISRAIFSDE